MGIVLKIRNPNSSFNGTCHSSVTAQIIMYLVFNTFMKEISYDDFVRLDIRVARVVSVDTIPEKNRIYQAVIDVGGQTRTIIVGGAQYYTPDSLIGKTVVVLLNLEPRTISGVTSEGMLLAADINDKPFWLSVPEEVPSGSHIR